MGVALAEPGVHGIVPPRQNGGNMDIRHLVKGTKLYLPIFVEGALFSIGDTHAAQGDGEVCGTAIEASMETTIKFTLHKGKTIKEPRYEIPGPDRKSTRLNSSHVAISYAVFCLKKKNL